MSEEHNKPSDQGGTQGMRAQAEEMVGRGARAARQATSRVQARAGGASGKGGEKGKTKPSSLKMPDNRTINEDIGELLTLGRRLIRIMGGLVVTIIIGVLLLGGAMFIAFHNKTTYFAVTPDLRLVRLVPMNVPAVPASAVMDWAARVVTDTLSVTFTDYKQQLMSVKEDYDSNAFNQVVGSLSATLKMIKDQRLNASAVVTKAPVLLASQVVNGKYAWLVQFPLTVSYESSQGVVNTQNLIATATIMRAPATTHPKQIVIRQLVLKVASGG